MSRLRLGVGVFLLAAVLAAGAGLVLAAQAEEQTGEKGQPPPPAKGAVTEVMAEMFGPAFTDNDALADERYLGKRLRVVGMVNAVRRERGAESPETYWLLMHGGAELGGFPSVKDPRELLLGFRFVGAEARKQLADLRTFEHVSVEGRCDGKGTPPGMREMILFRDCRLVARPDRPPEEDAAPDPDAPK